MLALKEIDQTKPMKYIPKISQIGTGQQGGKLVASNSSV